MPRSQNFIHFQPPDAPYCEVILIASYREGTLAASSKKKSGKPYFKKDAFEWNAELDEYRCPNDATLTRKSQEYRILSDDERLRVFRYRCDPVSCSACPLSVSCTKTPGRGRNQSTTHKQGELEPRR